jgi:DNA-binding LacI/PurR family transcriptional regulator
LQNHPHVAAATKEKVKAAARKLGYREDPALERYSLRKHASPESLSRILYHRDI